MSLFEKPHTVVVYTPVDADGESDGYAYAPDEASAVTVRCQITPKSAGFALDRYGVELSRPYKLMADPEDEATLVQGARVSWTANDRTRTFHIMTAPRYHGQGDEADHVSVMLEEYISA